MARTDIAAFIAGLTDGSVSEGTGRGSCHGGVLQRHDPYRSGRPDAVDARFRRSPVLARAGPPGCRQAFHGRCWRQCLADAGAHCRGLRACGTDDLGTRTWSYRGYARQDGSDSPAIRRCRTMRFSARWWPPAGCAIIGQTGNLAPSRQAVLWHPRCHRDSRIGAPDHRIHPVEKACSRARRDWFWMSNAAMAPSWTIRPAPLSWRARWWRLPPAPECPPRR
jgi:hypothetical protein